MLWWWRKEVCVGFLAFVCVVVFLFFFLFSLVLRNFPDNHLETQIIFFFILKKKSGVSLRILLSKSFCWKILGSFNYLTYRKNICRLFVCILIARSEIERILHTKLQNEVQLSWEQKMTVFASVSDGSRLQLCVSATSLCSILQMVCVWQLTASLSSALWHYSACIVAQN